MELEQLKENEQFNNLTSWIGESKKYFNSKDIKFMKDIPSDILAHQLLCGMKKLIGFSPQPRTNVFGDIGKIVFSGKETTDMEDGEINRIRIKIGGALMKVLFYKYKYIFAREETEEMKKGVNFNDLTDVTKKRVMAKFRGKTPKEDVLFTKRGKVIPTKNSRYMIYENKKSVSVTKRFKIKGKIIEKEEKIRIDENFAKAIFDYLDIDKIDDYLSPSFKDYHPRTKFFSKEKGQLVRNINLNNSKLYTLDECPILYDAINRMDSTLMKVDLELLEFYNNYGINNIARVKKPNLTGEQLVSKQREAKMSLAVANQIGHRYYRQYHFADFRKRMYPSLQWFNHCSNKMSKSLIRFAQEDPIGLEGWNWLLFNAANTFGYDKLPIDDRIVKAEKEHQKWIEEVQNPESKFWLKADSPFEFRAAVNELRYALEHYSTYEYCSGLPIGIDQTCSGLQEISGMVLSPQLGALCNTMNLGFRGDYYGKVADVAWNDPELHPYWVSRFDQRRGIIKRTAMVFLYAAGAKVMGEHIFRDHRGTEGFEGLTREAAANLGRIGKKACIATVPDAYNTMQAITELGLRQMENGGVFNAELPYSRFTMVLDARKDATSTLDYWFGGKKTKVRYIYEKQKWVNRRDILTGAAVDLVHGYDSETPTALACEFLPPFLGQHDCYFSNPTHTGYLFEKVRDVYVKKYEKKPLLKLFEHNDAVDILDNRGIKINDISILQNVYDDEYFCS